ncbi:hypothetical protein [Shivajiella indica]|uniref:Uncharacterized protein n=1 Tax=Shivajiella indica TaxID=872115 RepID=A0ABW5B9F5_9BACT
MKKINNVSRIAFNLLFMLSITVFSSCMNESNDMFDPVQDITIEDELALSQFDLIDDEVGAYLRMNPSVQNQLLASIRSATAKYHRLEVAESDEYVLDPHCVAVPGVGGMGHHAVNGEKIGPFVIPTEPGVLVYEPGNNGNYHLVAVEYLVPAEPWDLVNDGPPMLGNVSFDDHREMIEIEPGVFVNAKGGPPFPHYQLHVWIWKNNPDGIYKAFNPNVSCN